MNRICTLATVAGAALALSGCSSTQHQPVGAGPQRNIAEWAVDPPPPETQQAAAQPTQQNAGQTSDQRTHMAFPTGVDSTSVVAIDKAVPQEAVAGQPFDYSLLVTNLTDMPLRSVTVHDQLSGNVKVNNTSPPVMAGNTPDDLAWNLGDMKARETREIKINATPVDTGLITSCAKVTYASMLCQSINIVKPALEMTMILPKEASLCDAVPMKLTVTNRGSGEARDIHVRPALPLGFTTVDGKKDVDLVAGNLVAGQSKEFSIALKPQKTGHYSAKAAATGLNGLAAEVPPADITIRQPVLKIAENGREKQYLGRDIGFDITVTNTGDWPAVDTVVQSAVPAGAGFASATDGGMLTPAKDLVTWTLGTLEPKASKTITVNFASDQLGLLRCETAARATCATPVTAYAQTEIAGIPAVLLEMVDNPDPVEVGQNTVYTITVTNQGTATDTNIRLIGILEADGSMEYVGTTGTTTASFEGDRITMAPLAKLAPKAKAQWLVTIKAVKEHDSRFRVEMVTDQLTEGGVIKTEATHFYK